jgi:hypothetical protein
MCALSTSNQSACNPTQSQPVQSPQRGLPFSWIRRWRSFLSSVLLLLLCGSASAQLVNVVGWQNGVPALAANVMTVTGMDLDDSTTVLVVGMYGDNSPVANGFSAVTFGGVPPTGLINNTANTRAAMAYWINPNTAAGQTLSFTYATPNSGYYWAYQLSNVDTNALVATSGAQIQFGFTTSVTTLTNNSFVVSFFSGNNSSGVNALTPSAPLIQTGTTIVNAPAGASMSSATNTIASPGLVNIAWNIPPGHNLAQYGPGAFAFVPLNVGAPIVNGSISPSVTAPGGDYIMTVTINPFHSGNITNVTVDLSSIGGSPANALVQSSDPNVWTNSFVVPGGAPLGSTNLPVVAKQDAAPITGSGFVPINIAAPSAPVLVKDTVPSGSLSMYVGQGVTFSASFSAPGFVTYRWQKSPDNVTYTNIPGGSNTTYAIPSAVLGDAGYYRLQASNFLGTAESSGVQIVMNNPTSTSFIWSAPAPFAGLTAEQILTNFPANNKIAGAIVAQNGGNPISVILTNAGNRPVVFAGANNSWGSLSGGAAFISNVNTNNTRNNSFNSVLNLGYNNTAGLQNITLSGLVVGQQYQLQLFASDNRPGLTPDGSLQFSSFQDPSDPNGVTSEPTAMADNAYMLGRFTASSSEMTLQQNLPALAGNFNALVLRTVGWDPKPYFTVQPRNTNNFAGTRVTFTGSAAGDSTIASPAIVYQWASGPVGGPYTDLANGSKYAGVTNTTLTISNLVAGDATSVYVLKATNGGGTATSREASLYVQSQPAASPANSFAGAVLALTNVPNSRLSGLWRLNEIEDPSTGVVLAQDASGNGRNGVYGITSQNKFGGALSPQPPPYGGFASGQGALLTGSAGTGDATSVINLPPLNLTNVVDTTICMWIYPTAVVGNLGGLLYNRGPDQCGFGFGGNTGGPSGQRNLGFVWNNANGEATFAYNSGLFPINDTWNFVVLVMRTNAATFFLDYVDQNGSAFFGKAADTAARYTQNNWTGGPIWIGGDPSASGTTIFPGRISSVAVFNSALTDDQIYNLFVAGFQIAGFPASFVQHPPADTTNFVGYTLTLNTVIGGSKPTTNQWKFNGTNLVDGTYNGSIVSGSTSNVLTIQNVTTNWQGVFTLAVTNFLGGAISSNANVTILLPEAPPSGNLVGNWFDGTSSLADHSGHLPGTHNAYGAGASATNYVFTNNVPPGKSGSSLNLFGGTSMGISNSTSYDAGYVNTFDDGLANSFTVMTWAKGQPGVWNPFVSKNGETEGWQLRRSAGANAVFTIRNGGTPDPAGAAGGTGADGAWHHYAGTYDSVTGIRTLYVDGIVQNVLTGDAPYILSPGSKLVLGGKSEVTNTIVGNANFTGGSLYDVRIYNTALSYAQVAYIAAPPPPPASSQPITLSVSGGNPPQLTLSWGSGGKLLQSQNVFGPWVTNQAATSPYTVPATNNPALFFRVLYP